MRRALEVFREHAAAVVIEWLFDLMQAHIGGQGQILQELVAAELFAPRNPDKPLHPDLLAAYPEAEKGTRLDWLFLYHPRLWKRPRLNLKQIYVTILTLSHEHRLAVGESILSLYIGSLTILQPSAMPMSSTVSSMLTFSLTAKPKPLSNSLPWNCSPFPVLQRQWSATKTSTGASFRSSQPFSQTKYPTGALCGRPSTRGQWTLRRTRFGASGTCPSSRTFDTSAPTRACRPSYAPTVHT
jgi:hypothetical protein